MILAERALPKRHPALTYRVEWSATIGVVKASDSTFGRNVKDLSSGTRELLAKGASYWDGPGHADPRLAALMNFTKDQNPHMEFRRIAEGLRANESLSVRDLTRALLATEIGWVSVVLGPADWENVYGLGQDLRTLEALRTAQDELADRGVPVSGTDPFGVQGPPC